VTKFREKTVSASASPVFFLEILSPSSPILGHNWKHDLARSCFILEVLSRHRQRPARFSFLENSREFFFIFTSRSRSRAVSISLSLLEKEWRDFIFHFSLLEKSESYPYFTLFSREKRVKSGAGYNLTSIFVPNCISKNCQISSKHQPQNIGQISISKSWPNPVLQVWTKHQLKKSDKN